jgi:hypothetical protein
VQTIFDLIPSDVTIAEAADTALACYHRDMEARSSIGAAPAFAEFYASVLLLRQIARTCGFDVNDAFADLNVAIDIGAYPEPTTVYDLPSND